MSKNTPTEPVEEMDDVVEPEQALAAVPTPAGVVIVANGDSWRSLAETHAPKGSKVKDFAQLLADVNMHTPLRQGTRITLPQGK